MVNNIEKVLERSEKIEILVDKTDDLHTQSQSFKRKGTKLKRKMWWKNTKLCCCIVLIVTVILAVIIISLLSYFGVFSWLPNIFHRGGGGDSPAGTTAPPQYTTAPQHTSSYSSHISGTSQVLLALAGM